MTKTNLYKNFASEFSKTRQSAWEGWLNLTKYFVAEKPLSVLDLGCANGRFLKFLLSSSEFQVPSSQFKSYVGVDNSEELLEIGNRELGTRNWELGEDLTTTSFRHAGSRDKRIEFINSDLENRDWTAKVEGQKFNLVVAFGLMHHLKTFALRKNLVEDSAQLLEKGGYLIISFWQFKKDKNFFDKHFVSKEGDKDEISKDNNFILKFGASATRFCHNFTELEISSLSNVKNLESVESFYADGKSKDMNKYVILRKI